MNLSKKKDCPLRAIAIRSLVANYSIRGPEFFEKTAKEPIPEGNIVYLEKLKEENAKLLTGYVNNFKNIDNTMNFVDDLKLQREKTSD